MTEPKRVKGLLILPEANIAHKARVIENDALAPERDRGRLIFPGHLQAVDLQCLRIRDNRLAGNILHRVGKIVTQMRDAFDLAEEAPSVTCLVIITKPPAHRQRCCVVKSALIDLFGPQPNIKDGATLTCLRWCCAKYANRRDRRTHHERCSQPGH